jgi:hypothetical protein
MIDLSTITVKEIRVDSTIKPINKATTYVLTTVRPKPPRPLQKPGTKKSKTK